MKLITDIRQRHLEKFEALYFVDVEDRKGVSTETGAAVRAAVEAGWFADVPNGYDVADEKPSVVRALAQQVNDLYLDIIKIDPNS